MGRLYLPLSDLRAAGIDPDAFLADPRPSPALGAVVRRLLAEADVLYARAAAGVAGLPPACRPGIEAARLLYAEIGREVERRGCDSVSTRAVVPGARKLRLVARALAATLGYAPEERAPALHQVRFIVDAVAAGPRPAEPARPGALIRLLALFERLEKLERGGVRV
jgi:phytoene synthase